MIGENIGKYRVLDRVGRGGMGTVYRALDETLHREVAIKVLNAELNEPEVARRFRAEAITVARLSHPGIATIYELFEHDGRWLMVMEFVRGETFEQIVSRAGGLDPEQAAVLCMQSLAALAHAHAMGVVHRDLKPANLMRTLGGDVKVMDFGIARVSGAEHLTSVGFMMGTPAYMAPEQVQGTEIDARADLYAMGVVLFRLLTGQLPFKADTPFAMAQAQVNAEPLSIDQVRPGLPFWVGQTLDRALRKQPADRFQSAMEFHGALQQALAASLTPTPTSSLAPTGMMPTPRPMPIDSHAETMATPVATSARPVIAAVSSTSETMATPSATALPVLPAATAGPDAAEKVAPAGPVPTSKPPQSSPDRRGLPAAGRSGLLLAGAAAIVVVMLAAGWWAMSSPEPAPSDTSVADVATDAGLAPTDPVSTEPEATEPVITGGATPPESPGASAPARAGSPASPGASARGARAGGAASPAPVSAAPATPAAMAAREAPADSVPSVRVTGIRVLVVDGRRAQDREATLDLADGQVVAMAADGQTLASFPYRSVRAATYTYARNPRWRPELAAPPADLDVGGVFRTSRHYLTLQSADDYLILRLEDINVIQVIRELETRTGLSIPRTSGG